MKAEITIKKALHRSSPEDRFKRLMADQRYPDTILKPTLQVYRESVPVEFREI